MKNRAVRAARFKGRMEGALYFSDESPVPDGLDAVPDDPVVALDSPPEGALSGVVPVVPPGAVSGGFSWVSEGMLGAAGAGACVCSSPDLWQPDVRIVKETGSTTEKNIESIFFFIVLLPLFLLIIMSPPQ